MLDTLLEIGKTLRAANELKYHRYFRRAPIYEGIKTAKYFSIPVDKDFQFNFDDKQQVEDQVAIRNQYYYFRFKTSEASNQVLYVFGDVYYALDKKSKEVGSYRIKPNSFRIKKEYLKPFNRANILRFRESFERQIERIESFLREEGKQNDIFLHFDYFRDKHWYELEAEFECIQQGVVDTFFREQNGRLVLKKSLYKTLSSPEKDSQFPHFVVEHQYKTRGFSSEEATNLLYAIDYSKEPVIKIQDMKIIILPKADDLTAQELEDFFVKKNPDAQTQAERTVSGRTSSDLLFKRVVENVLPETTQFDFIFSEAGKVDVDAIELSGIEKSFLSDLNERIKEIRNKVLKERDNLYSIIPADFEHLDIQNSFRHVLDGTVLEDVKKNKKLRNKQRFQTHLFKVLPQIYSGAYYRDQILLPALIDNTELKIRNAKKKTEARDYFNFSKYDFFFLTMLRLDGEQFMALMKNTPSYKAGRLLGELARPISLKITPFSKTHVGMLSRRIADVRSLIKMVNEVDEILSRHELANEKRRKLSQELSAYIREMSDRDYIKDFCVFGFFETYFEKREENSGQQGAADNGGLVSNAPQQSTER